MHRLRASHALPVALSLALVAAFLVPGPRAGIGNGFGAGSDYAAVGATSEADGLTSGADGVVRVTAAAAVPFAASLPASKHDLRSPAERVPTGPAEAGASLLAARAGQAPGERGVECAARRPEGAAVRAGAARYRLLCTYRL